MIPFTLCPEALFTRTRSSSKRAEPRLTTIDRKVFDQVLELGSLGLERYDERIFRAGENLFCDMDVALCVFITTPLQPDMFIAILGEEGSWEAVPGPFSQRVICSAWHVQSSSCEKNQYFGQLQNDNMPITEEAIVKIRESILRTKKVYDVVEGWLKA